MIFPIRMKTLGNDSLVARIHIYQSCGIHETCIYIYSARLYAEITTSDNGLGAGFPMKTDSVSPHSSLSRQSPFIHKINLTNVLMFFLKKKNWKRYKCIREQTFFFFVISCMKQIFWSICERVLYKTWKILWFFVENFFCTTFHSQMDKLMVEKKIVFVAENFGRE